MKCLSLHLDDVNVSMKQGKKKASSKKEPVAPPPPKVPSFASTPLSPLKYHALKNKIDSLADLSTADTVVPELLESIRGLGGLLPSPESPSWDACSRLPLALTNACTVVKLHGCGTTIVGMSGLVLKSVNNAFENVLNASCSNFDKTSNPEALPVLMAMFHANLPDVFLQAAVAILTQGDDKKLDDVQDIFQVVMMDISMQVDVCHNSHYQSSLSVVTVM